MQRPDDGEDDDSAEEEDTLSPEERSAGQQMARREHAVDEIHETELMYYTKLKLTLDVFINPLREAKVLDEGELNAQFLGWETLLGLHKDFSEALSQHEGNVGQKFKLYSHLFKMYQPYLNNYSRASARRAELLTTNRRFADFVDRARRDPRMLQLHIGGLNDLLVGPVQRIPRYELLLSALLNYTPPDHPERDDVEAALEMIRGVARCNNEAIGESEESRKNQEKLLDIMMSFTYTSRCNLLDDPSRVLLKEGLLRRQTRRAAKDFYFWLFSDKLLYGELVPGSSGLYSLHRDISLMQSRIGPVTPSLSTSCEEEERAFMVQSPQKSFIVWGADEAEAVAWIKAIERATLACRDSYFLQHKQEAQFWEPDHDDGSSHTACELCGAGFSMLRRRRQVCPGCKKDVCDACLRHRVPMPSSRKAQQQDCPACDDCYKVFVDHLSESAKERHFEHVSRTLRSLSGSSTSGGGGGGVEVRGVFAAAVHSMKAAGLGLTSVLSHSSSFSSSSSSSSSPSPSPLSGQSSSSSSSSVRLSSAVIAAGPPHDASSSSSSGGGSGASRSSFVVAPDPSGRQSFSGAYADYDPMDGFRRYRQAVEQSRGVGSPSSGPPDPPSSSSSSLSSSSSPPPSLLTTRSSTTRRRSVEEEVLILQLAEQGEDLIPGAEDVDARDSIQPSVPLKDNWDWGGQ